MTALDLDAAIEREKKAHAELIRILSVDQQTHMSIPANPSRDTDLIIQAALNDVPALVAKLRELLALVGPIIERIDPDQIGTHSDRCHEYHVACLALAVRARIAGLT